VFIYEKKWRHPTTPSAKLRRCFADTLTRPPLRGSFDLLEMDGNLLHGLETGLMAFHQRFMSPPQLTAVSTETPLSTDAPVADKSAPSVDEKATVVTLPTSPNPDEPGRAGDDRGPNFVERARKWVGAE